VNQVDQTTQKRLPRNSYLSLCRVIVQMSDSYGNPKVSQLSHARLNQLITPFQDDCSSTFSGTSISGNISTVSAVGCDPLGRTDSGDSRNTLDGENGPVLKDCQSIKLNSEFTEINMQQSGNSIVKYQSCNLGGHEFVFNVNRSGSYVFVSSMTYGGVSINLKLNVDVDSGITTTNQASSCADLRQEFQVVSGLLLLVITYGN
jgi:hypothetical protein